MMWALPILMVGIDQRACGDQVLHGDQNYSHVRIRGFEEGKLVFRAFDGTEYAAWIDEIRLIVVDTAAGLADFNEAERYAADGEPDKSIVRYERSLRRAKNPWDRLITARLVQACDRAGRLDRAVMYFIKLAAGGTNDEPAASRLIPGNIPRERNATVIRAVEQLDERLKSETGEAATCLLHLLKYRILLETADQPPVEQRQLVAGLAIPVAVRSEEAYEILFAAIARSLSESPDMAVIDNLEQAISDCPRSTLPRFLLLKGRSLARMATTDDDRTRACLVLLRIPIHSPQAVEAPEALYEAALMLEQLNRADKAAELLDECLGHKALSEATRGLADEALRRIRGGG